MKSKSNLAATSFPGSSFSQGRKREDPGNKVDPIAYKAEIWEQIVYLGYCDLKQHVNSPFHSSRRHIVSNRANTILRLPVTCIIQKQ